jgi:predicted site-specific integrase-resolvase
MQTLLTPPEVAKLYRVAVETVHGWIRSGELSAIDVARRGSRRPRFRVSLDSLSAFDQRRSVSKPVAKPRRLTLPKGMVQYV